MKTLRIQFLHFWKGFDYKRRFAFLLRHYHLEITDKPDFVVFSTYVDGTRVKRMPRVRTNAVRVFYAPENVRPDMKRCDYAFSYFHEDAVGSDRHFRLPSYVLRLWDNGYTGEHLIKGNLDPSRILREKTRFCNFIYSNRHARVRNRFFRRLSRYKRIDAAGSVYNNIGYRLPRGVQNKLDFIRRYKFTIAFENVSSPGYTTEKVVEPMLVHSLPIYWGDPEVGRDFNPKSLINYYDCGRNLDDVVEKVIAVDRDDDLYAQYIREPYFHQNVISPYMDMERVVEQFRTVFG